LSTTAGFHVPVIPSMEVEGNIGAAAPAQIVCELPKLNVGVTFGLTVTESVVVTAHCPAAGVNVYTADAVLLTVAGFQVPVMLLLDVAGRAGVASPSHIVTAVPKSNEGVSLGVTVTYIVLLLAQAPADGVNV
jgi:hypothetical protein